MLRTWNFQTMVTTPCVFFYSPSTCSVKLFSDSENNFSIQPCWWGWPGVTQQVCISISGGVSIVWVWYEQGYPVKFSEINKLEGDLKTKLGSLIVTDPPNENSTALQNLPHCPTLLYIVITSYQSNVVNISSKIFSVLFKVVLSLPRPTLCPGVVMARKLSWLCLGQGLVIGLVEAERLSCN